MVMDSVPEAQHMRGERDKKAVADMIAGIYAHGLHMHGGPDSPVNREVLPAMHFIIGRLSELPARSQKRVQALKSLVEACQDGQQVQARTILRVFGDFIAQAQSLQSQLKYSLLRMKEAALQRLITKWHPSCDGGDTS